MSTLDINTNGSWRTVVSDLRPGVEAAVKAACVTVTNASVAPGQSRARGVTWRLRDAEGYVFAHLQYSATDEGTVTTAWSFK